MMGCWSSTGWGLSRWKGAPGGGLFCKVGNGWSRTLRFTGGSIWGGCFRGWARRGVRGGGRGKETKRRRDGETQRICSMFSGDAGEGLAGEAVDGPLGLRAGAEFLVEADGGFVPVEDGPFQAPAAGVGDFGNVGQEGSAQT